MLEKDLLCPSFDLTPWLIRQGFEIHQSHLSNQKRCYDPKSPRTNFLTHMTWGDAISAVTPDLGSGIGFQELSPSLKPRNIRQRVEKPMTRANHGAYPDFAHYARGTRNDQAPCNLFSSMNSNSPRYSARG